MFRSATVVDPLTARFGPAGAADRAGLATFADVDQDGDLDLLLHFRTEETGIACGATQVTLSAETFAGERVTAADAVLTVGCK